MPIMCNGYIINENPDIPCFPLRTSQSPEGESLLRS